MSSGFSLVLIAGIAMFATGMGGSLALPLMGVGALGLIISAFTPTPKRRPRSTDFDSSAR